MSKLQRFLGQSKTFKIGEEDIEIKPLTVKNLDVLMGLSKKGEEHIALDRLIRLSLKKSVPDATDDEIDNISLEYFKDFMDAILEVNNMEVDEEIKKEALGKLPLASRVDSPTV